MRCTDCNRVVKPVVALDIDGTLGDHHGHFHEFAEEYVGQPLGPGSLLYTALGVRTGKRPVYTYDMEFSDWLQLPKQLYREVKLAYRQGGMKRMMPADMAAEWLVDRLRAQGAEVWLCTTRPWQRLDNIDPDTREWCRRNSISYDGLIYGEDKYHQLAELVGKERVVAVLDDLPEMYDEAEALGLDVILKQNGHRGDALRTARATTLGEAAELIWTKMQYWHNRQEETS